jgi:hypothetical protein
MNSITSKISIIILSLMAFACSSTEDKPAQEEWLFVHTADEAQVTNNTTIVMPVTRDIFAFTDRPYRKHAYMTGEQFASLWAEAGSNSFKADPPNAVLTWVEGEVVKEAEVVIKDASIDGSSITYTRKYSATIPSGTLKSVSLFVDSSVSKVSPDNGGDPDASKGEDPDDNGGDPDASKGEDPDDNGGDPDASKGEDPYDNGGDPEGEVLWSPPKGCVPSVCSPCGQIEC